MSPIRLLRALTVGVALYVPSLAAIELGGQSIDAPGRVDLRLEVPAGADDPATFIPVTVLTGRQPARSCSWWPACMASSFTPSWPLSVWPKKSTPRN